MTVFDVVDDDNDVDGGGANTDHVDYKNVGK